MKQFAWYENPKTHITYTYIFDTVGENAPEEQNEIYITDTQFKTSRYRRWKLGIGESEQWQIQFLLNEVIKPT